jgi:hypothetical protein
MFLFIDILDKIIVDNYDFGMLLKLQQFIKVVHNNTYISGENVHFSSSFLLFVAIRTSICELDYVYCDIFDLLVSLYSQKVSEKDENCKALCDNIITTYARTAYGTQLLSKFLDFIDNYDLLKNDTEALRNLFYSRFRYNEFKCDVTDIMKSLPTDDKLTDRFVIFVMDFIEQSKLTNPTFYNEPNHIMFTKKCLQCYLNKTSCTNATKQRVESFLDSYNSNNSTNE